MPEQVISLIDNQEYDWADLGLKAYQDVAEKDPLDEMSTRNWGDERLTHSLICTKCLTFSIYFHLLQFIISGDVRLTKQLMHTKICIISAINRLHKQQLLKSIFRNVVVLVQVPENTTQSFRYNICSKELSSSKVTFETFYFFS